LQGGNRTKLFSGLFEEEDQQWPDIKSSGPLLNFFAQD